MSRLFRWLDFFTFGLPSTVVTGITIYAGANGVSGEPLILLAVMTAMFDLIYCYLIFYRWQQIKNINYSVFGMDVICNNHPVKKEDMEKIISKTIDMWAVVLKTKGVDSPNTLAVEAIDGLLISWENFPIVNQWGKFAGLAFGKYVQVGYKEDLNSTALAHEIGEFIFGKYNKGILSSPLCHQFMKENNLP